MLSNQTHSRCRDGIHPTRCWTPCCLCMCCCMAGCKSVWLRAAEDPSARETHAQAKGMRRRAHAGRSAGGRWTLMEHYSSCTRCTRWRCFSHHLHNFQPSRHLVHAQPQGDELGGGGSQRHAAHPAPAPAPAGDVPRAFFACFDVCTSPFLTPAERRTGRWRADVNGALLILHSLAPCVTFLRFEPSARKGLAIHSMTCYHSEVREQQGC